MLIYLDNLRFVIDSYVQGIIKRYVNPVTFFGIILTINGLNIFIFSKFYEKYLDASKLLSGLESANNEGPKRIMALSSDISLEYASLFFSLLIPIAAFVCLVIF